MERLGCDLTHDYVRVVDIQGVYHGDRSFNLSWSRAFLYQNWWQNCCRNFGKTPSLATMFTASCHITRALWTQTYNLWSHLQLVFELSQLLAAWKGCLSRAQGVDERARTHVQQAKILQQEDTWPVEVDPNFGRGAYGLEDVPLTGKFPNKRDERTIDIHISSPASKRRWIVTVSSSWYKPRDACICFEWDQMSYRRLGPFGWIGHVILAVFILRTPPLSV